MKEYERYSKQNFELARRIDLLRNLILRLKQPHFMANAETRLGRCASGSKDQLIKTCAIPFRSHDIL